MAVSTVSDTSGSPAYVAADPSSVTYTLTGVDLDSDTIADTLTVVMNLTTAATTTNPATGSGQAGTAGWGIADTGGSNPDIQLGESVTFSFGTISAVLSGGGMATYSSDFTTVRSVGNATYDFSLGTNGSTPTDRTPGTIALAGLNETSFTLAGTAGRGGIQFVGFDVTVDAIPEPSSAMLLGAVGLLGLLRRRK